MFMSNLDPTVQPTRYVYSGEKSPEGKSVEILAFGVYNNPLLLREAHTID